MLETHYFRQRMSPHLSLCMADGQTFRPGIQDKHFYLPINPYINCIIFLFWLWSHLISQQQSRRWTSSHSLLPSCSHRTKYKIGIVKSPATKKEPTLKGGLSCECLLYWQSDQIRVDKTEAYSKNQLQFGVTAGVAHPLPQSKILISHTNLSQFIREWMTRDNRAEERH